MPVTSAPRRLWWRLLAWLVLALLVVFCLLWWFPASWAWSLARSHLPHTQLTAPSGTLWNGHADVLQIDGQPVGALDWHIGHAALLGNLAGDVRLRSARWSGHAHFLRSGTHQFDFDHVQATMPASLLGAPEWLRGLRPGGMLRVDVRHLRLRNNWPVQCAGAVHWRDATLADARGTADLGDLSARVGMRAGTTLQAVFSDSGTGPLAVHGSATVTPLGWRLQLNMQPRGSHPLLRRMLARFGAVDAEGHILVQRHAGLFSRRSQ